jgi:hypothetical protein
MTGNVFPLVLDTLSEVKVLLSNLAGMHAMASMPRMKHKGLLHHHASCIMPQHTQRIRQHVHVSQTWPVLCRDPGEADHRPRVLMIMGLAASLDAWKPQIHDMLSVSVRPPATSFLTRRYPRHCSRAGSHAVPVTAEVAACPHFEGRFDVCAPNAGQ